MENLLLLHIQTSVATAEKAITDNADVPTLISVLLGLCSALYNILSTGKGLHDMRGTLLPATDLIARQAALEGYDASDMDKAKWCIWTAMITYCLLASASLCFICFIGFKTTLIFL